MYMSAIYNMTKCPHLTLVYLVVAVAWLTSIIGWCTLADGHTVCDIYDVEASIIL